MVPRDAEHAVLRVSVGAGRLVAYLSHTHTHEGTNERVRARLLVLASLLAEGHPPRMSAACVEGGFAAAWDGGVKVRVRA